MEVSFQRKENRTTARRLKSSQAQNDAVELVMIMGETGKVEDLERSLMEATKPDKARQAWSVMGTWAIDSGRHSSLCRGTSTP